MTDSDHADGPVDDGYDGPAQLLHADHPPLDVTVTLRGHFDPISGKYRWYGRVAADPAVTALAAAARTVTLRTPHAEVVTSLSDVDPWGRPRVEGFGAAPFAVLDTVSDD